VTVRQVHDPVARGPLSGVTLSLHVRWQTVPEAYRSFLRTRLAPGGTAVLVRDLRTWPILDTPGGYSFQVGSPTGGWTPDRYSTDDPGFGRLLSGIGEDRWPEPGGGTIWRYAETSGDPALEPELRRIVEGAGGVSHRVLYNNAAAFSAAVADLLRAWMRAGHCVVGTGRMTDPGRVIAGGMVPYWCESASRPAVRAAELWLAGARPFDVITVLPEPPGVVSDDVAGLSQWRSLAGFATGAGRVDTLLARRYPLLPTAPGYAPGFPGAGPAGPPIAPLPMDEAVRGLARDATPLGLLVA
jgi:hypothetical protein